MIKYEEDNKFNNSTGEDTTILMFISDKKDRYAIAKIKRIIKLIVDKRNNEEELCKEITTLLDESMRDYYDELKERV